MNTLRWLLKREFWEHRGGFFWAPVWTGVAVLALSLLGMLAGETQLRIHMNDGAMQINGMNAIGTFLAHANPDQVRKAGELVSASLFGLNGLFSLVTGFVLFFFLLGALYDDRRDRSVLFWKSLPVSDALTVVSKALMAAVLVPLLVFGLMLVCWIGLQLLLSVFILIHGGSPWTLIWGQHTLLPVFTLLLALLPAHMLWSLLAVGWLLLCSAAVPSKPFLWAVLIPVLFGVLNGWVGIMGLPNLPAWFTWGAVIKRMLLGTFGMISAGPDTGAVVDVAKKFSDGMVSTWDAVGNGLATVYTAPALWIGALVGIAMIAGAVWFRRRGGEA